MEKNIKHVSQCIAEKLIINPDIVEKWVETNNFDLNELAIISGQITYGKNNIFHLVESIIFNGAYVISEK